jgi:hypothetical protein
MNPAATARTESKTPATGAPILSLVEHIRAGHSVEIRTGEVFAVGFASATERQAALREVAELQQRNRALARPTIIIPRVRPTNPWIPRRPTARSLRRFVQIPDSLYLDILHAELPTVAQTLLWAILWKQLTAFRRTGDPAPAAMIGLHEFAQVTGYSKSGVCKGLAYLDQRNIIGVEPGGGQKTVSAYRITSPANWQEP